MQYLEYKESAEHGSFGFPIEIYHLNVTHPRYVMSCHWHPEYEVIRIREGRFSYVMEGESGVAGPGDILFVNGGFLHAGTPENCVYECIVFDLNMLLKQMDVCHSVLREFHEHNFLLRQRIPAESEALHDTVNRLFEVLTRKACGYQLVTQGLLYQMFGHIVEKKHYIENSNEKYGAERRTKQLKNVLELIEENYSSVITLSQLAQAAGMTPKYFCHFFQVMTGRTPIDYLNHHRVEVACLHIMARKRPVTELAYECGFNDLSYFIRVFKRYKGTTPKQYCKQLRS